MTAGLILVAVATVFIQSGETSFAGIIFIGPFPIIFGAGPGAQWLILVLMTLAVLMLIMLIILRVRSSLLLFPLCHRTRTRIRAPVR
jgi:uncharacterized membrane protein